ncbi:MAG TPA: response regulator [Candidatus Saccharimonadales bacterium]
MKKILIVEDEIAYVKLLRTRLEFNYKVLDASNGQDGLKIAKKEHPDLILLDIIMPIMDGMAMLKELRKDHWGKDAKVILLTNLEASDKIVAQVTTDLPIYYFVKSDVKLDDLLDKIYGLVPAN